MEYTVGTASSGDVLLQATVADLVQKKKRADEVRFPGAVRAYYDVDRAKSQSLDGFDTHKTADGYVIECCQRLRLT